MNIAKPWRSLCAYEGLSCYYQSRDEADQQSDHTKVAQQQDVRHRLAPVVLPMLHAVPRQRCDRQNADNRVEQYSPLNCRVERTECHCQTREKLEEKNCRCRSRQHAEPTGSKASICTS